MDRVARIQAFVETVRDWYAQNKRALPWRDLPDPDPAVRAYKVMVSEIMLQQTQVSRVKIIFKSFLEKFPTIADLARASNREVLLAWRGMGYNGRALRLRDAARSIVGRLQIADCKKSNRNLQSASCNSFVFPESMEELQSIPGIGSYTAAAIRNFAFNIPTPCIDTNIRRILHRTFVGPENADGTWKKDDTYLLKLAGVILNVALVHSSTADWHAALMDFGSIIQTKRNQHWEDCPLTAKGIMKTTKVRWERLQIAHSTLQIAEKKEPGRLVGARYIPNRIFRGKVIEELRDAETGLSLETIGKRVCMDWSTMAHRRWLKEIVEKLIQERMVQMWQGRYRLFGDD